MPPTYESLRAFISSPKDVTAERTIVEKVIKSVSNACKETLGVEIECVSWDDFIPQTSKLPDERIQDKLNLEVRKCNIFILILWKRYGSIEPGKSKANTERETEIALDLLKKEKKIILLTYFRDLPETEDPGPQQKSVEEFRNTLQKQGVWFKGYKTVPQFQEIFTHDLYRAIMRFRLSTKKHIALSKFWVFGIPNRPTHPSLVIIYPAMERSFMGPQNDPNVWLNRLEPNMVFEDYKALQKMENTLHLVGFRDFRICSSTGIPSDVQYMNRFWMCLPRNTRGLQQLHLYRDISRFDIIPRRNRADSYILWNTNGAKVHSFIVHSPVAKYLREQRSGMDITGNWNIGMDQIIVKDYTILARFKDRRKIVAMDYHYLNDFFLSGIRGLGTWGAGWFIDRKYQVFDNLDEKLDFQFLLEVEYRNGRIYDVKDVSDQPREYFEKENNINTIRKNITNFKA